jgi:hypothetical protein
LSSIKNKCMSAGESCLIISFLLYVMAIILLMGGPSEKERP